MSDSANNRSRKAWRRARLGQGGVGLLELVIAMSVLTVGMLGSMIMIVLGMQSNTRNKTDTTATVLDQEILETFATLKNYPLTGTVTINDCALTGANAHTAAYVQGTAAAGGAGAPLTAAGEIDWTQPTPALATAATAGYAMMYQTCSGDIYEVRWNVMDANPAPLALSRLSILTVSSRQRLAKGSHLAMLFAPPTTLRTLIENSSF